MFKYEFDDVWFLLLSILLRLRLWLLWLLLGFFSARNHRFDVIAISNFNKRAHTSTSTHSGCCCFKRRKPTKAADELQNKSDHRKLMVVEILTRWRQTFSSMLIMMVLFSCFYMLVASGRLSILVFFCASLSINFFSSFFFSSFIVTFFSEHFFGISLNAEKLYTYV